MVEIDEMSAAVGALRADQDQARASREIVHRQIDMLVSRTDEILVKLALLEALAPEIRHYADFRRRFAGGVAVIIVIAGILGACAEEALKAILHR